MVNMRKEDWKIIDVIIALLMLLLSTAIVVFILAIISYKTNYEFNKLIFICFEIIVTLPSIAYLYRKYPVSIFAVENATKLIKYSFVGLFASITINISLLQGPAEIPEEYDFLLKGSISPKVVYLILICILVPIIEEVFFRGMIYRILKHRYDIVTAIVVGTGIFTFFHAFGGYDSDSLFVVALSGLLFIYVYEKSGSLLTSIVTHSLYNSVWFYFIHLGAQ